MLALAKSAVHTTKTCLAMNPFQAKIREFKSLEANIGPLCLSSESGDININEDNLISKHEVSASLPNLAYICPENEQKDECLNNFEESTNVPIQNIYNKIKSNENCIESVEIDTEVDASILNTDVELTEPTGPDICDGCENERNSETCTNETQENKPIDSFQTDSCSVLSYESNEVSPIDSLVTGRTYSNTEVDLLKENELKDSPRSSPGNTLDSGNYSLGRTDSFGKTDASSFSSVSSISTGIECAINESDIREESLNSETDVTLQCPNSAETTCNTESQEIDSATGVKPKRKSLTFGGFLSRWACFKSYNFSLLIGCHCSGFGCFGNGRGKY